MDSATERFRFMDLPYDLREMIWLYCLPSRIYSVDGLHRHNIWEQMDDYYDDDDVDVYLEVEFGERRPPKCWLWESDKINDGPPLIARVCRESRKIAHRALSIPHQKKARLPESVHWELDRVAQGEIWLDHRRSTPHLYHDDGRDCEEPFSHRPTNSLIYLADMATIFASRTASFMLWELPKSYNLPEEPEKLNHPNESDPPILDPPDPASIHGYKTADGGPAKWFVRECQALARVDRWQVVMGIVVVHCSRTDRKADGYFGLLNDAPIQIVEVTERARIAELTSLARSCNENCDTGTRQDFECTEISPELMLRRLRYVLWHGGFPTRLHERLHPAIMFRLCRNQCHLSNTTTNEDGKS